MGKRSQLLVWSAVTLSIMVLGLHLWWNHWFQDPVRLMEQSLGVAFPGGTHLLVEDEQWISFLGDGHKLWIIQFPEGFGERLVEDCDAIGLAYSETIPKRLGLAAAGEHFEPGKPSCFELTEDVSSFDFTLLNGSKLFFYISNR